MGNGEKTIADVIKYWDQNPVHSVEFERGVDLKKYIDEIDSLRWSDNERWARKNFYEFGEGTGKRLLDAGCGIGVLSRFYAKKGYAVHSIDISQEAVRIARESFRILGLRGEILVGSVEELPYRDNYFDFIVSNGVIHHTPGTEKAVEEFCRVLKPGGIASVCVYYRNMLLRRPIFNVMLFCLKILLKKKDGRNDLLVAQTPEEFVRAYDGNNTPIAKIYTRREADRLFSKFEILKVECHYFPIRFLRLFKTGGVIHQFLDKKFGVLIYYLLRKPS